MKANYIEFKKERDLGAIITDAFKFIRTEWKPFFTTVFKIAIVPILIAIIAVLYYTYSMSDMMTGVDVNQGDTPNFSAMGGMFLSLGVMMIAYIVAYTYVNLGALYYIKSYIKNKGIVNAQEVQENVKEKFWSFLGLGFLSGLIIIASALLCFFPVIYTGVVLSLASSILVFENKNVSDAISSSFNFIKGHFWNTLGVMIVVGLLVGVLGSIFSIPALIYQLVQTGVSFGKDDPTAVLSLFKDPVYLFLTILSYIGKFLFYAITLVTTVFIYFDINEQKNATGSFETIDNLGR